MNLSQNPKLYYILPAVVLIIIIVIVLLLPKKSSNDNIQPSPSKNPLPTLVPIEKTQTPNTTPKSQPQGPDNLPTPTLIPPTYTGAEIDQHIPQAETDLAVQKSELRKKTPLSQPTFTITFDYAEDIFVTTLKEPKDTSRTEFLQWLQANYPSIPLDRFSIR